MSEKELPETIPGVNASEGDPPYVDESMEHDFEFGKAGVTETFARGMHDERSEAATARFGARTLKEHQQGIDRLPPKEGGILSKSRRARRKQERTLDDDIFMKGHDLEGRSRGGYSGMVAGDLMVAPHLSKEQRLQTAKGLQQDAVILDEDSEISGEAAVMQFKRDQRAAAERIVGEQPESKV